MFAVATPKEGLELRAAGVRKPVLLFGSAFEYLEDAIRARLTLTLFSSDYARRVSDLAGRLNMRADAHVKVETGLNRLGFRTRDDNLEARCAEIGELYSLPNLDVSGIYSHFSASDSEDPGDVAFTGGQLRIFLELTRRLEAAGIRPGIRHFCASQAILHCPDAHLDMLRSGILVLGVYYDEETIVRLGLRPSMTWKARVVSVRAIRAGESVSYGRRFRADRDMTIALVAAGYADGYKRRFSNKGRVLAHGRFAPVLGSICMDSLLIDAGGTPELKEGDCVTLLGAEGENRIWINELGRFNSEIDVEVILGMSRRVPRLFLSGGRVAAVRQYDDFSHHPPLPPEILAEGNSCP